MFLSYHIEFHFSISLTLFPSSREIFSRTIAADFILQLFPSLLNHKRMVIKKSCLWKLLSTPITMKESATIFAPYHNFSHSCKSKSCKHVHITKWNCFHTHDSACRQIRNIVVIQRYIILMQSKYLYFISDCLFQFSAQGNILNKPNIAIIFVHITAQTGLSYSNLEHFSPILVKKKPMLRKSNIGVFLYASQSFNHIF